MDPNAMEDYRLSAGSQQSSNDSNQAASRQSSRGNLNGYQNGPGLSAPPARPHQRQQPSISNNGHYRQQSDLQPQITRQTSSLSQPSNGGTQTNSVGNGAMKIKIYFENDLIAIKVPSDINFDQLKDKLHDRLRVDPQDDIAIQYKDEASGEFPNLMSDNDLDTALHRNPKLTLYVKYM
jgi:bud emergence protein 1